ncbi:hypothetical protein DUNSADRAFT_13484 [Dunaliella salina]|uniref:Anaphase-promoting complex subunit 1 n=1 Tax=Dunaliella salina TaxID=3046 RepID=A0ABQ7G990_DUNSA|nr:hypothetical protein DUNSADRAFT_13484 [Dunaliella salina]|eukprot:KAF5831181.1 hypothetical protein DUNSADRAFT_13484 [Dunaliella salina]
MLSKQSCVIECTEGPVLVLDWRSEVHGGSLLVTLYHAHRQSKYLFSGDEGPVLVLDWRSEVHGDGLLAQLCHPLPDSLAEGQGQQQQQQQGARGSEDGGEPGCSLACILDALQEEQRAMRTEQSCAGGLLGVGGVRAGMLPTGGTLTLGRAAYCSPKAVLQVQRWQMARSGPPPQLAALPLSPRLSSALVATHPSPAMRRLAYQAGVAPRVDAFWGVLDALRSVRDAISAFQGYPSFAHRAWLGTSAGSPSAVACFLIDMAAALRPLAGAEVERLIASLPAADPSYGRPRAAQQQQQQRQQQQQQQQQRQGRHQQQPPGDAPSPRLEGKQWSRAGSKIDPWDLEFAQEAAASYSQTHGTPPAKSPGSPMAHLFPL